MRYTYLSKAQEEQMKRKPSVRTSKSTMWHQPKPKHLNILVALAVMVATAAGGYYVMSSRASSTLLDRTVFNRQDLIYGSEIGAWDMDGGTSVNNAAARANIINAKIRVIRWGDWAKFDYMGQGGSTPKQTLAQFNNAVDGIRGLGAIPLIKLPPIWDKQCDGSLDYWNLDWQKEIIKNAGSRVQLYEFGNEPDGYCGWTSATYTSNWKQMVPQLKAYARSLGFEIYVGGPAMANSYPENVAYVQNFLDGVKAAYQQTANRDVVPDFVSSHTYLTETENATTAAMQSRIDAWGTFYDNVYAAINTTFAGVNDPAGAPLAPQIKIADSEWDWTINNANTAANDQAYADYYMKAMFTMLRQHHVWLSAQFTAASHGGGALDLLNTDGTAKPLYNAYRAMSTTDPLNVGASPSPSVSVSPSATPTPTPSATPSPTPTPGGDTIAPTVTISSPTTTVVSGQVSIAASAKDNVKVTGMKIEVDGVVQATSRTGTVSTTWNTRREASGQHTITVRANDAAGNVGVKTIIVFK
jgi:hypothetical protein